MATKEKIKKKKDKSTGLFTGKKSSKSKQALNDGHTITDDNEEKTEESRQEILTDSGKNQNAEENTKDVGREKERSDTPSPPPAYEPAAEETMPQLGNVASPKYKRKRSTSPFPQNRVEPLPGTSKEISNPGSLVSVRSGHSVKEAWTDNEEEKSRPASAISKSSISSKTSKTSQSVSRRSSKSDILSVHSNTAEQNAYIPYLYARGCILRMTNDMKFMKEKHVRIVHDIEAHYRSLEGESQVQFLAFVTQYKEKFGGKLDIFRNVMEKYRQETQLKEATLLQEIESLNESNAKLLQEKNEALSVSKQEVEKIDAEKVALAAQVTAMAGGVGAAEYAKLKEENESLKAEVSKLSSVSPAHTHSESTSSSVVPILGAVPVPVRDSEEEKKLTKQISELKTENAKLSAINEALMVQVQQSSGIMERYNTLENQYKALSLVVMASPNSKGLAKESLAKTEEDSVMMKEEEKRLEGEIKHWEKKFKKENGREPSEEDKPDSVKELYVQKEEAAVMLVALNDQKETLTKLNSGVVPPAPETPAAADFKQTEIQTIEVPVPDPEMVSALEASQQEVEELKLQLAEVAVAGVGGEQVDQSELDACNAALLQERAAHDNTKAELEDVQRQLEVISQALNSERAEIDAKLEQYKKVLEAKVTAREEQIAQLKSRNEELEEERLKDVPLDTAKEIKNLQNKIAVLEDEKALVTVAQASVSTQVSDLTRKLKAAEEKVEAQKAQQVQLEERLKVARKEKDDAVRDLTKLLSKRGPAPISRQKSKLGAGAGDVASLKRENQELNTKIRQLEREVSVGGAAFVAGAAGDKNVQKRHEKILKELEKRYDMERAKCAKLNENLKAKEEEAMTLQKDLTKKSAELAKVSGELAALGVAAKEGVEAATKVKSLEKENKKLLEEHKILTENFNSERVLRKKYYNMVEDMKGKIRVYCRARPLSSSEKGRGNYSVLKSVDEYTIAVESQRGVKEFQYDQVFMEESTQEQIFEDTNNLIQSAVDGYNVCIFAYGQTGSGKTFTMIGGSDRSYPGIAPRAFERIFQLAEENKSKFTTSVHVYMMELYNDRLIDLLAKPGTSDDEKMEIKKDKKGLVFVHGAVVKPANNAKELQGIFESGSENRHTASTKMNAESSRSHLILSIVMETTNKSTGAVLKGKLSLVDLAGSERVGKTGATAEQLKEAMSINKSLSALGDVISALSSEQSFIPYRNNKLTMLMQDSLGGNAKTLMFVNISPADYNVDETVVSLTYASRVKLITNDASKNADNKEIARLKGIIAKLKKGDRVADDEVEEA